MQKIRTQRGDVKITPQLRESFDQFAKDCWWIYIPDMDGYESFFDSSFADPVFYILQLYLDQEKDKLSDDEMQKEIISHFAAKSEYKPMVHQTYFKYANYEDGFYSPWIEERREKDREFYLLNGLDIQEIEPGYLSIAVKVSEYYIEDTSDAEQNSTDIFIKGKAEEMGVDTLQAAKKLIASGEISQIQCSHSWDTTLVLNIEDMTYKFIKSSCQSH